MRIQDMLLTCVKEEEKEKLNKVQNAFEEILKNKVSRTSKSLNKEIKCDYLDEEYKILSYSGEFPYDDFAIAINNKSEIYIIYSYDGAYGFSSVRLSELLHCLMGVEI